jgi:hypothetical protein
MTLPPRSRIGTGPGSAGICFWISRPNPSEYEKLAWIRTPPAGAGSLAWLSRASATATAGGFLDASGSRQ